MYILVFSVPFYIIKGEKTLVPTKEFDFVTHNRIRTCYIALSLVF